MLVITFAVRAQAPQGINYQAVALDALGNPVANQSVSTRLSILDGGATGAVLYQESHNPTTDNTGLFSIVIGNGTVISGSFSTINWGNGARWLKTEVDITGGTSYVLMGSSQFMSVPYALYANRAQSALGSFQHPDGLDNITPIQLYDSIPYTVPAGKNLYMNKGDARIDNLLLYDLSLTTGSKMYNFLGASPGSIVKFRGIGFLVDKIVDWKTIDLKLTALVVPAGKLFVIVCQYERLPGYCYPALNGNTIDRNLPVLTNSIIDSGSTLSVTGGGCGSTGEMVINGYFRDK